MTIERITQILSDFRDLGSMEITAETTFEAIGLDSLDVVDLIMKLEEETGVSIPMTDDLKTIGKVVDFINTNKA